MTIDAPSPAVADAAFVREHLLPRVPAHRPGAIADWPAVRSWSVEGLAERFGDRVLTRAFDEGDVRLGDWAAALARGEDVPYLRNLWLAEALPELEPDARIPAIARPSWFEAAPLRDHVPERWSRWVELFLSGAGARYPDVHVDAFMTHAWLAQIAGVKEIWLWPPIPLQMALVRCGLEDSLAPGPVGRDTDLDALFAHARPRRVVLEPGDLAFLPAGWWHTTETHAASITLSGNFVNASNWDDFCVAARGGGLLADDDETRAALAEFARTAPPLPVARGDDR